MKKTLFILALVLGFTTFVNAQYKPTSGFDVEVNFSPFSTSPVQLDYIKARMFLSEKMALRLGFQLNTYNETSKALFGPVATQVTEETKNSYFILGFHPGIEFHMEGTDRLSPYCGAELNFTTKSASTDITNYNGTTNSTYASTGEWKSGSQMGYTQIGLNLLFGADYYISKHLYLGVELGFGFNSTSYKDNTITVVIPNTTTTPTTNPGSSAFNLGVNYNSFLRLGWAFD